MTTTPDSLPAEPVQETGAETPSVTPPEANRIAIGVDFGGTGIKGSSVNLDTGELLGERIRIPTPHPATPESVAPVIAEIVKQSPFTDDSTPLGVTFPGVILNGVAQTAANVDKSWIGTNIEELFQQATNRPVTLVNDADAAGIAEARYGAAKDVHGLVFLATLGTGIGSAILVDGHTLVPNTELGHLEIDGKEAEALASGTARDREDLSWKKYAKRLQKYFSTIEALFWPEVIVVGGGVSKRSEKFLPELKLRAPIIPAKLLNNAGIVGAAAVAADAVNSPEKPQTQLPETHAATTGKTE